MPPKPRRKLFVPKSKWKASKKGKQSGEATASSRGKNAEKIDDTQRETHDDINFLGESSACEEDHNYFFAEKTLNTRREIHDINVHGESSACEEDHNYFCAKKPLNTPAQAASFTAIADSSLIHLDEPSYAGVSLDGDSSSIISDGIHNLSLNDNSCLSVCHGDSSGVPTDFELQNETSEVLVTTDTTIPMPILTEEIKALQAAVAAFLQEHSLPPRWKAEATDSGLHVMLITNGEARLIQRSVLWNLEGKVKVFVHGVELKSDHPFSSCLKDFTMSGNSVPALSELLYKVISEMRLYDVCTGVTKLKFKKFWNRSDCFVDYNPFQEARFNTTCRSVSCLRIVHHRSRLCTSCAKLQKSFYKRAPPPSPNLKQDIKTPNKFKPYAACTSVEKKKRVDRYRKDLRNLRTQMQRLRLRKIINEESIEVDKDLDSDLLSILESEREQRTAEQSSTSKTDSTENDKNKEFDFHLFFLEQQLEARKKGPHGMRWHPLMVRFALQLRMLSHTCYSAMTSNNFIVLPSERTLFDYTHAIKARAGCINEIIEDVAKKVADMKEDYQHYHVLSFDEVSISENLVQKKSTGEIIGYCNLTEVQEEIIKPNLT